jgi:hypothetical protein
MFQQCYPNQSGCLCKVLPQSGSAVAHLCNLCPRQYNPKLLVKISSRLMNTAAPVSGGHGQGQKGALDPGAGDAYASSTVGDTQSITPFMSIFQPHGGTCASTEAWPSKESSNTLHGGVDGSSIRPWWVMASWYTDELQYMNC